MIKLPWNEKVPLNTTLRWQRWLDKLIPLKTFSVNRCFTSKDFGSIASAQLHNFLYASEAGYRAVSYLRLLNDKGELNVTFAIGNEHTKIGIGSSHLSCTLRQDVESRVAVSSG